jgi:hypothetical protein
MVCALEHDELGARDVVGEVFGLGELEDVLVSPVQDEGRRLQRR